MRFVESLISEEHFDDDEGVWLFRNGGQCAICTDGATRIAEHFKGAVIGYYAKDNQTAQIGEPHAEGHDFALIQSRWLVDYWAWRYAELVRTPIFDLDEEGDCCIAYRLYGPVECWSLIHTYTKQEHGGRLDRFGEHARAQCILRYDEARGRRTEGGEVA